MKLHLGGQQPRRDWTIVDIIPGPYVDEVCDVKNLNFCQDFSVEHIYASHVLEHFSFQEEVPLVLREWFRVLKPHGKLWISVPDMLKIGKMLLESQDTAEHVDLMRMLFGGQIDSYDLHKIGFDRLILTGYLHTTGFVHIEETTGFNLFDDCSSMLFKDKPISLNMTCEKP